MSDGAFLTIAQKAGEPRWAAQICGFTLGGWWPTKAQAEVFARNAEPVIAARVQIEVEWALRKAQIDGGPR